MCVCVGMSAYICACIYVCVRVLYERTCVYVCVCVFYVSVRVCTLSPFNSLVRTSLLLSDFPSLCGCLVIIRGFADEGEEKGRKRAGKG